MARFLIKSGPVPGLAMCPMNSLTYRDAGVDIDRGEELVRRIRPHAERTRRPEMRGGLGGFGALFDIPLDRYKRPVLVTGTDGVGTKIRLALDHGQVDTIGIDLVAMCVNDILTQGAEPLLFLDYYATGRLDVDQAERIVAGIAKGCELAGAALAGGETAEMPGMYADGDVDLAGFTVGLVEADHIIDGTQVTPGDCILGLASSGPHSNGYSLIRRILDLTDRPLPDFKGRDGLDAILAPTRIYVRSVLSVLPHFDIHAMAHITGGGLLDNIPRVLPRGLSAQLEAGSWPRPDLFGWLALTGGIDNKEMLRTFNCGIGYVLIAAAEQTEELVGALRDAGEAVFELGTIVESPRDGSPISIG
jgi:phosphoribosylformylglycinamidine cyclo-ligase